MIKWLLPSVLVFFAVSCQQAPPPPPPLPLPSSAEITNPPVSEKEQPLLTWVDSVETAHEKRAFLSHDSIRFDIQLFFGGTKRLDAQMTLATNSSGGRLQNADGTFIKFHESEVIHNTKRTEESVRFSAYTWSYFFLFPYKMSDAGTHWTAYDNGLLNQEELDAQKLTFDPGTGDAPDDWYISYTDPYNHLTKAAAYIVTAGGTVEEAEEDPHAISYHRYVVVDGVPFATSWSFWSWRDGQLTEKLGYAELSNMTFING